jgi:hypothetical protein
MTKTATLLEQATETLEAAAAEKLNEFKEQCPLFHKVLDKLESENLPLKQFIESMWRGGYLCGFTDAAKAALEDGPSKIPINRKRPKK